MAGVAKWLRLRIVVPAFVGSTPTIRPICLFFAVFEFVKDWKEFYSKVLAVCILMSVLRETDRLLFWESWLV